MVDRSGSLEHGKSRHDDRQTNHAGVVDHGSPSGYQGRDSHTVRDFRMAIKPICGFNASTLQRVSWRCFGYIGSNRTGWRAMVHLDPELILPTMRLMTQRAGRTVKFAFVKQLARSLIWEN
jgi:hypothetical protein